MIKDIITTPLKQFEDDRGKVMHMLRSDDPHFIKFGEIYFSWVNQGIVKAWSKHKEMVLNFAVPVGDIKLVVYDDRVGSETYKEFNEFYMSDKDYYLLTIPNNVWYGFKALNNAAAMVVNCSTLQHDPKEIVRIPFDDLSIQYNWGNA